MSITGIYYVPCNPESPTTESRKIVQNLKGFYQPSRAGRWNLEYKLLRDTPSCLPASNFPSGQAPTPRYMHFISCSHFQTHGFVYISKRPEIDPLNPQGKEPTPLPQQATAPTQTSLLVGVQQQTLNVQAQGSPEAGQQQAPVPPPDDSQMQMITLDPSSYISYFAMTLRTCAPLWNHRHTVQIASDDVYEVADFRIRIGDVRQTQPKARLRGAIVEIEYRGPGRRSETQKSQPAGQGQMQETANEFHDFSWDINTWSPNSGPDIPCQSDWEIGVVLIREFWKNIAVKGAVEAIDVPGVGAERQEYYRNGGERAHTQQQKTNILGTDLARQYIEVLKFYR
ncbi:hypothetical protein FQN57_006022 [Myotisia sp. PD_48]|nr:hypothetical protein FQN57_006022 [Myotisia sp. PD_48]